MSRIKVDSIVPRGGLPTGASGGGIIQIVQNVQGIGLIENSGTSEYDIGLNCTITPQRSDSKILINANWPAIQNGAFGIDYYLSRGTTHIHMIQLYQGLSGSWTASCPNMVYLDSPSITSPVTYKISAKTQSGGTLRTNYELYTNDDTTVHGELTGYGSRSTMILMEVSG